MSYTKIEQPLTPNDIVVIKSLYGKIRLVLVIMFVLFTGFGVGIGIWADEIAPIIIIGLFDFGILFGFYYVSQLTKREIKAGIKTIITGVITEKKEKATSTTSGTNTRRHTDTKVEYFFVFDDLEIPVYRNDYIKYHAGDKLEIAISAIARTVLSVKLLEESPVKNATKSHTGSPSVSSFIDELNIVEMDDDELAYLTNIRNRRLIYTTLWSISLGFLTYWVLMIALVVIITFEGVKPTVQNIVIGRYGIIALILLCIVLVYFKRVIPFIRDVMMKRKRIIPVTIDDKIFSNSKLLNKTWRVSSSRGDFYYLVVGGRYLSVTEKAFDAFETNEEVKIHKAQFSGKLLRVEGHKVKVPIFTSI